METVNKQNKVFDYKALVMGLVLFLAMAFSSMAEMERVYNVIPFSASYYGLAGLEETTYKMIKYGGPLILAVFYYLIYNFYTSVICNSANARMRLFNKEISKASVRSLIDPIFIVLCIVIGALDFIYLYFPLLEQMMRMPLRVVCAGIAAFFMYKRLLKGLDEIYNPIIFSSLVWPIALLVILI